MPTTPAAVVSTEIGVALSPVPATGSGPRGRRHRSRDSTSIAVECLTRHADVAGLEPEWRALYEAGAQRNPYASPDWIGAWLAHFVRGEELAVLAVRRYGRLVGVAPCYRRRIGWAARTVQLAGTARAAGLTEQPQVLTAPGQTRSVLRAVVAHWLDRTAQWDWLELPLDADQGWFEPQWLGEGRAVRGMVQHKTTRAAVLFPLSGDATTVREALRRNVWESVKRSRNRLGKADPEWTTTVHDTPQAVASALPWLRDLHAARAEAAGRRTHPDFLGDPACYAFVADAVGRMAASGRAELYTLDVRGKCVAAQLVLRAPAASYFALSGVDPNWWHAGPVTLLQYTALERAAERGDAEVNLSVGPDISKLRWSERVVQHPEFVVCGPRARSRRALTAYAALASVAAIRRETARHRVREGALGGDRI